MPRHFAWRDGRWLVVDEESGLYRYSDDITRDYYGKLITKRYADPPHPQEFVHARDDDIAPPFTSIREKPEISLVLTTEDAPDNFFINFSKFVITDETGNVPLEYDPGDT